MRAARWRWRRFQDANPPFEPDMHHPSPLLTGLGLCPILIVLASCIAPALAATDGGGAATDAPAAVALAAQIQIDGQAEQGALLRGRILPATGRLTRDGESLAVASDGSFLLGFDRDASGSVTLRLDPGNGAPPVERRLDIAARSWALQNINAPMRGAARSDADFEARRPGEIAQMVAARRTVVTSDGWRQQFIWPLRGRISGVFGSQRIYQGTPGSFHNGVDVAAPTGTPYVAPADGVVILAATTPFTLEGYLLMIDHGMGLSSVFLHSNRLVVHTGEIVRQGQHLGDVGATGRVTGPHLHWAMRWQGAKIDAARLPGPMTR